MTQGAQVTLPAPDLGGLHPPGLESGSSSCTQLLRGATWALPLAFGLSCNVGLWVRTYLDLILALLLAGCVTVGSCEAS